MKKTMIALAALSGFAVADIESLDLTPGYETTGEVKNFVEDYVNRDAGSGIMNYFTGNGSPSYITGQALTFTFDVPNMLGIEQVSDTDVITLNSLTYFGHVSGWFTGNSRTVTISVQGTEQSVSVPLTSQTTHRIDLDFSSVETPLTFGKNDTLLVSIASTNAAEGITASLLIDNKGQNPQVTGISMQNGLDFQNAYMIAKMNVSVASAPEPATATLSLLALAGLASRRRRR